MPDRQVHDIVAFMQEDVNEILLSKCRFVVDAVHHVYGTVFLFYCSTETAADPFYVVLCDERSKRKAEPVRPKTLDLVKRIRCIALRPHVKRNAQSTLLESSRNSRSASHASDQTLSRENETPLGDDWCETLLHLSESVIEGMEGVDEQHRRRFTAECQSALHNPDDVRRLYHWSLCSPAAINTPLHVSLRQLALFEDHLAGPSGVFSPKSGFEASESFIAYCDPLHISTSQMVNDGEETPVRTAVVDQVVSPLTPAWTSVNNTSVNSSSCNAYLRRGVMHADMNRGAAIVTPMMDNSSVAPVKGSTTVPLRSLTTAHRGRRWDASYL